MTELRSIPRTEVATRAFIFFGSRRAVMECTALDLSTGGGKIALDRLYALPRHFLLSFDDFRSAKNCELIWSRGNFVGVQFRPAAGAKA